MCIRDSLRRGEGKGVQEKGWERRGEWVPPLSEILNTPLSKSTYLSQQVKWFHWAKVLSAKVWSKSKSYYSFSVLFCYRLHYTEMFWSYISAVWDVDSLSSFLTVKYILMYYLLYSCEVSTDCQTNIGRDVQYGTETGTVLTDWGYVHIDTSPSPGFRLRVVCHSYKLHPHEWSVRGHLYKHITQRVSIDNLQRNRIE